jgi:hypothetical protein
MNEHTLSQEFWTNLFALAREDDEVVQEELPTLPRIGSLWRRKGGRRRGVVKSATLIWVRLCFNEVTGASRDYALKQFLELYQEV